jgi:hypothetical protein
MTDPRHQQRAADDQDEAGKHAHESGTKRENL